MSAERGRRVAVQSRRPRTGLLLSVVVPLYDEAGSVPHLLERLSAVLGSIPYEHEVILVDDGSRDATWEAIAAVAAGDPAVRGLRLSRNFGHQAALFAGLRHAAGDAVVTMDGDLQHPPEVIPELIAAWEQGFAIVNTRRIDPAGTSLLKRKTSKYFYALFSSLAEIELAEGTSDFRLMDRQAVDALLELRETHLFLRGAVQWLGFPTATIPFRAAERHAGVSKFGWWKMIALGTGAMVSYSTRLLHLGTWLGLLTSGFAFLFLIKTLIEYAQGRTVPGWATTVGLTVLLFGILFVLLGIIGLYLARIHTALQSRPPYLVAETVGREPRRSAGKRRPDGVRAGLP